MDISDKDAQLRLNGVPFCRVVIVKSEGSSPRHIGSRMIVTAEESFGTVGGGGIEHQAIREARELLRSRRSECRHYVLSHEAGTQPCGGTVDLFYEPVIPKLKMVIFGAGHIGEVLCPILLALNYDVFIVDDRKERLTLPAFENMPNRICERPVDFLSKLKFDGNLHLISITHSHQYDEQIVEYCLDKPFRYLGLISSRTKWTIFRERYQKKGFDEKQLSRVSTPVGLDIGAETPFEIAIAIAAELIKLHSQDKKAK